MRADSPDKTGRRLRADGRRNRAALLSRAGELIAEKGPDVPLDEIARAAGVGNATLYRHFPDRAALLRAIAVDVVTGTAEAAERALAEEADSAAAFTRYLRDALRVRVAWVMPAIATTLADDAELAALRARSVTAISALLANAQRDGAIRPDLTFGDVSLLLIRLARPLPPHRGRDVQDAVADRHLAILLAGMSPSTEPLPGTGLELTDLRRRGGPKRPHRSAGVPS